MAERRRVEGQVVHLDYREFQNVDFVRCGIVYSGGLPPNLIDTNFVECSWNFDNGARNTIEFLKKVAENGPEGVLFVHKLLGIKDA